MVMITPSLSGTWGADVENERDKKNKGAGECGLTDPPPDV